MPKVWHRRDPNVPKDAVYVGRPTKWGNPYAVGRYILTTEGKKIRIANREAAVFLFHQAVSRDTKKVALIKAELRGKDLVCWCAPLQCHADVLLEIANA